MAEATCSIDDCDRRAQPSHGLCKKHYSARWYRENHERERAKQAEYKARHCDKYRAADAARYQRERVRRLAEEADRYRTDPAFAERKRAAAREWRAANRDRAQARQRADYRRNKARYNALSAAYYAAHRDEMRTANERWKAEHPEQTALLYRNGKHRRRAREAGGKVTKADLAAILAEHGMVCHICGGEIASLADLHFDHVIPLAKGGDHSPENIRPSHAICNRRKGARLIA